MEFDKYKKYGAYHWNDIERSKLKEYSLPLWTRYTTILNKINKSVDLCVEIGCGDGALTYLLSKKNINKVIACDTNEYSISLAKRECADANIKSGSIDFYNIDFTQLNIDNESIDIVVLADVIEHVEDAGLLLSNIVKKIKPGGMLLITTPLKKNDGVWDKNHITEFTEKSLFELLTQYFDEVQINGFMHSKLYRLYNRYSFIKTTMNIMALFNINLFNIKILKKNTMLFASASLKDNCI